MTEFLYSTIGGDTMTESEASPEGVVTASKGSLHTDTLTQIIWIKTVDGGNEGWEPVVGGVGGPGGLPYGYVPNPSEEEGPAINITSGARTDGLGGHGGELIITGGLGDGGSEGGAVWLIGGDSTDADGYTAGAVNLQGGNSTGTPSGDGGAVTLRSGTSESGLGGDITLYPEIGATGTGLIVLFNLPEADPVRAGALWNDAGTLKVSAGE